MDKLFQERRVVEELFNVSKNDKNHYINIVALLCCITICKQRKVLPKNITEKEEISSSNSDFKPNLNKNKNLYPIQISKKSKLKQETRNKKQGNYYSKACTCSGWTTSVKVPMGLQKSETQIWKVRDQEYT